MADPAPAGRVMTTVRPRNPDSEVVCRTIMATSLESYGSVPATPSLFLGLRANSSRRAPLD
jgi:hypothetical protein